MCKVCFGRPLQPLPAHFAPPQRLTSTQTQHTTHTNPPYPRNYHQQAPHPPPFHPVNLLISFRPPPHPPTTHTPTGKPPCPPPPTTPPRCPPSSRPCAPKASSNPPQPAQGKTWSSPMTFTLYTRGSTASSKPSLRISSIATPSKLRPWASSSKQPSKQG